MRALSSAVSVGTHIAIVMVALVATARQPVRAGSRVQPPILIWNDPGDHPEHRVRLPVMSTPAPPDIDPDWGVVPIAVPVRLPQTSAGGWFAESTSVSTSPPGVSRGPVWSPFGETRPEVLSAPLPRYPDLLRQAGIGGRVVLEAVVDTAGRAERASIVIAEATNPAFVGPAREALLATLFRPGAVNGRAVRVRVRIPYEFTLKDGTSHAR